MIIYILNHYGYQGNDYSAHHATLHGAMDTYMALPTGSEYSTKKDVEAPFIRCEINGDWEVNHSSGEAYAECVTKGGAMEDCSVRIYAIELGP